MDTTDNRENLLKRLAGPIQVNILEYNEIQQKFLLFLYLFLYVKENFVAPHIILTKLHGYAINH